jgi:hypothetical protein
MIDAARGGGRSLSKSRTASGGHGGPILVQTETPPLRLYDINDGDLNAMEAHAQSGFSNAISGAIGAFLGAAPNAYQAMAYFLRPEGPPPDAAARIALLIAICALVTAIVLILIRRSKSRINPFDSIRNRKTLGSA